MIRSYSYRSPRLRTAFPIEFQTGENTVLGICTDLSPDGLRAHMQNELPGGTEGWLTLLVPGHCERTIAIVANSSGEDAGFAFRLGSSEESDGLRELIRAVQNP